MILRSLTALALLALTTASVHADAIYNLNVQIIQVCDDAGANCTDLGPSGGVDTSYLYTSQVNQIWSQAGIQVTYLPTVQWNNSAAQRLTSAEQSGIYGNTFSAGTGSALPGLATDAVQIFFVKDHPGTGYNGINGSGWVGSPLPNPMFSARNAGNAQLFIDGTFSSNGRSVMANEGFASDSLSGTLAHEIGHLLGLRHVQDVNAGAGAGTVQDPDYLIANTTPNLMWGAGLGPSFDSGQTLVQNYDLTAAQIAAVIHNGTNLDPDGNGIGVLQAVPEPSAMMVLIAASLCGVVRRRRS